jgi:hypothetical protein
MSAMTLGVARRSRSGTFERGQSLAEFSLILPILIIVLLVVADFSRIFAAGVVVEGAARNAAEAAANEYLKSPPGPMSTSAPSPGNASYYSRLNLTAAKVACSDSRSLPNTTFDAGTGTCATWPIVRVCIHDGAASNGCGEPSAGFASTVPSDCDQVPPSGDPKWTSSMAGGETGQTRFVEVVVCYPFTTIMPVPIVPNTVYVQRSRIFAIACFQDPTVASC